MRVVVVGCGRVGAGLAAAGEVVAVVDKDPKAFERLGEDFAGATVEGIQRGRGQGGQGRLPGPAGDRPDP